MVDTEYFQWDSETHRQALNTFVPWFMKKINTTVQKVESPFSNLPFPLR
jgi:hypothetical protein